MPLTMHHGDDPNPSGMALYLHDFVMVAMRPGHVEYVIPRTWSKHSFPGLPCLCFYSMQKLSPNWKDQMGLLILGVRLRPGKLFHISTSCETCHLNCHYMYRLSNYDTPTLMAVVTACPHAN